MHCKRQNHVGSSDLPLLRKTAPVGLDKGTYKAQYVCSMYPQLISAGDTFPLPNLPLAQSVCLTPYAPCVQCFHKLPLPSLSSLATRDSERVCTYARSCATYSWHDAAIHFQVDRSYTPYPAQPVVQGIEVDFHPRKYGQRTNLSTNAYGGTIGC